MFPIVVRFAKNRRGATAIEYGLVAALIAIMLIAVFPIFQTALQTAFTWIASSMAIPA